jgi:hypothetical protein
LQELRLIGGGRVPCFLDIRYDGFVGNRVGTKRDENIDKEENPLYGPEDGIRG